MKLIARKIIDVKNDLTNISQIPLGDKSGFGVVYKGKYHKRHKSRADEVFDCAIKYIHSKRDFTKDFELFHQELIAQDLIKHPALLPMLGYYIPFYGVGQLTLVTPLMKNGSLRKLLDLEKQCLASMEWDNIKRTITIIGIAAGLCRMHRENLVHRDIKPENILMDDEFHPKICDFGLSKVFEEGLEEMLQRTNCGTEFYMAPELIVGDGKYNSKVDVYAYGLVLYELFANETFYYRCVQEKKTYIGAIVNGYRPDLTKDKRFPPFFAKLITDCWATDPNLRPTFDEIIESLLRSYEEGELIQREPEIDDYIIDTIECLDFDIGFI